jgi:hypothetical protein
MVLVGLLAFVGVAASNDAICKKPEQVNYVCARRGCVGSVFIRQCPQWGAWNSVERCSWSEPKQCGDCGSVDSSLRQPCQFFDVRGPGGSWPIEKQRA